MGRPKQLVQLEGVSLIRRAVTTALNSVCESVIVVLGSSAGAIREELAQLPVEIVENADWEGGMGTSIRAGVTAAAENNADGVILMLADQPLVSAAILNRLVLTNRATGQPIVASRYAGTVGVPVYFEREFFPHLRALKPQEGCKGLILANQSQTVRIECPEAEVDLDTPEDLAGMDPGRMRVV